MLFRSHEIDDIARYIGLDSLHYLTIEGLLSSVSEPQNYCLACFNGEYPIEPCLGTAKDCFEQEKALSW